MDFNYILETIKKHQKNILRVLISGGEPMMHTEIRNILTLPTIFNDIAFVINTNGSFQFQEYSDLLTKWTIAISLHGNKDCHNEYTKSNEFENIVKNIEFLKSKKYRLHLYSVVHNDMSVDDIDWLINFRNKNNISFLRFILPRMYGRYEKLVDKQLVQYLELKNKDQRLGIKIKNSNTFFVGVNKNERSTY